MLPEQLQTGGGGGTVGLMVGVGVGVDVTVGGAIVGLTVGIGVTVGTIISGSHREWSLSGVGVGLPILSAGAINLHKMMNAKNTMAPKAIALRVKLILTSYGIGGGANNAITISTTAHPISIKQRSAVFLSFT